MKEIKFVCDNFTGTFYSRQVAGPGSARWRKVMDYGNAGVGMDIVGMLRHAGVRVTVVDRPDPDALEFVRRLKKRTKH